MATAVDAAVAEVTGALADMALPHEGLRDFARLNVQEATRQEVQAAIVVYDRRRDRLEAVRVALRELLADGYPVLDIREVEDAVLRDLRENTTSIEAAMTKFASGAAVTLKLGAGAKEPKR